MSKIIIAGTSVTVTSALKLDDIKKLERFNPEALKMVEPETKAELFKVGTKSADINAYGISFTEKDASGRATLTKLIPGPAEKRTQFVTENYGKALMNFEAMEATMNAALVELNTQEATLLDAINVVDAE